jgi:hypothetical protein
MKSMEVASTKEIKQGTLDDTKLDEIRKEKDE